MYLNLNMTQAAYVDSRAPDVNYPLEVHDAVMLHRNKEANEESFLYVGFEAFPSTLKRKRLVSVTPVYIYGGYHSSISNNSFIQGCLSTFDKNTLIWNNRPGAGSNLLYRPSSAGGNNYDCLAYYSAGWIEHPDVPTTYERSKHAKEVLKYSTLRVYNAPTQEERSYRLSAGSYSNPTTPYLVVNYDEVDLTSQITPQNNLSGYVNPATDQTFKWDFLPADANYVCAGDFAQASATLFWKEHSASAYNRIAASGTTKAVTVPANTFPNNTQIDWYVSGTDEDGTTTTSSVYTISTADAEAVATATAPLNIVADGNGPITFTWSLSNAYGNDPSRVRVWWKQPSEDNDHWHVLTDQNAAINSYTAPAGTFPAGEIQWKVQAFNADGVGGPWDANLPNPKTFICVAAPDAPNGISTDGAPFTTITWQCEGQQAYRIVIDGKDYGVKFGTAKSFTLDEPLSDGEHTVSITAQGVYGLWSQAGTATFTVQNQPGEDIELVVTGDFDANLMWTTAEDTQDFYIYRDEVKIGHTVNTSFADRMALGSHSYYVINRLPSGHYSKSNVFSATLTANETRIAEYPPQAWVGARLSESSNAKQIFSYQKTVSTRHFLGANYPLAEMSPFEDSVGTYDAAFIDQAGAKAFERLKGKPVCIKSRRGEVFVGVIVSMQKNVGEFYTSFTITVRRIHLEDYVDDTLT